MVSLLVDPVKKRSPLWYELPLLFTIIGGIIAYYKIRKDDPKKARNCLIIGSLDLVIIIGIVSLMAFGTENPFVTQFMESPIQYIINLIILCIPIVMHFRFKKENSSKQDENLEDV